MWNPICNAVVQSMYTSDRDHRISRYTSTNELLTSYREKGESRVRLARRKAASDVLVGMTDDIVPLEIAGDENFNLLETGTRQFLTLCDCPECTKETILKSGRGPGFSCWLLDLKL